MCGICGVRRFGEEPIHKEQIDIMLLGNERRGNHATGVAIQQQDGSLNVYKDDEPAARVVASRAYEEFMEENLREDSKCVIGHTRAATKGPPAVMKNNHPLWDDTTAVVHNGVLNNDDFLFRDLHLERVAETDSDIFRAILTEHGLTPNGLNICNRISGSAAIAALSKKFPGKLLLARSGNPIVTATTDQHLLWSSEKQPIYEALRPFYKKFGFWQRRMRVDAGFMPMPNDTAWLIGDNGRETPDGPDFIEWHQEFHVAHYYNARNYDVHSNYHTKRAEGKALIVVCKGVKLDGSGKPCAKNISITPQQRAQGLKGLYCRSCRTYLDGSGVASAD